MFGAWNHATVEVLSFPRLWIHPYLSSPTKPTLEMRKKSTTRIARDSRSRVFVTIVNLCALVNGGQHLSVSLVCTSGGCGDYFSSFFFYRGRSGVVYTAISKRVPVFLAT